MSRRIEEILAVLKEIKNLFFPGTDLVELRSKVTKKVAQEYGVTEETIRDTYTRQLGLNTAGFDKLVEEWIIRNNYIPLMKKLLEHSIDDEDKKESANFLKDLKKEQRMRLLV